MEKKTQDPIIFCPLHVSQAIQKIDSRLETRQHGYCSDCILESEDPKSLAKSLISINQFLSDAAIFYTTHQPLVSPAGEIPTEYAEVLSAKAENLEKLTKQIDDQKKSLENIFAEITKIVLEVIVQKKISYIQMLNDQIVSVTGRYNAFEKELKKVFPKAEDLEFLYPSKEELENRLSKIENASQLATFIKGIKDDIAHNRLKERSNLDKQDLKLLELLSKKLKESTAKQPSFQTKSMILNDLVVPLKGNLDQFLNQTLFLKDSVLPGSLEPRIDSKIIENKDWNQIKDWLPPKYKSLKPNLLYRGTRDGFQQHIFHQNCDGKGPTITIVKCYFNQTQRQRVIGAFLDQSWQQNGTYIYSEEAFVFSLTEQAKYNNMNYSCAAFGHPSYGPTFGANYEFTVMAPDSSSFIQKNGSYNLYDGFREPNTNRNRPSAFQVQEIEVYNLI